MLAAQRLLPRSASLSHCRRWFGVQGKNAVPQKGLAGGKPFVYQDVFEPVTPVDIPYTKITSDFVTPIDIPSFNGQGAFVVAWHGASGNVIFDSHCRPSGSLNPICSPSSSILFSTFLHCQLLLLSPHNVRRHSRGVTPTRYHLISFLMPFPLSCHYHAQARPREVSKCNPRDSSCSQPQPCAKSRTSCDQVTSNRCPTSCRIRKRVTMTSLSHWSCSKTPTWLRIWCCQAARTQALPW